ncbi:hypothetical protein [Francisella halioticida]|nr:hypothetical protein [Francisella halioticida]
MYFYVVVAAVIDVFMYNKNLTGIEVFGILIVCAAGILSVIKKK